MALSISYFGGSDAITMQCYGELIGTVAVTLTGSDASMGVPPANAAIARITAGEACFVSNNTTAVSATNGVSMATASTMDLAIIRGNPIRAKT
jgi:hypothetical protein